VQVFGDSHGNVVHLFERDCSLQRRHQKVIEEAPAPGMDEATRAAICAAAVKAARAVDYVGAGTIEFIADASEGLRADRIWFMEMNTRLQVEHPVTEKITGQDLVAWQLRVASGEKLPKTQDELAIKGWAIEARLYAEDPANGFLPAIGILGFMPIDSISRIDTGYDVNDAISPFYDPMIAKLITSGSTRRSAIDGLIHALEESPIGPVKTNAHFLVAALSHPDFRAGNITTAFLTEHIDALTTVSAPSPDVRNLAADYFAGRRKQWSHEFPATDVWSRATGLRLNAADDRSVRLNWNGEAMTGLADAGGPNLPNYFATYDGTWYVNEHGYTYAITQGFEGGSAGTTEGDGAIISPMPGKLIAVAVRKGDVVTKGQKLVTLEAMKMEHSLTAPFDGIVAELSATEGAQVSEGALLARIEKGEGND
jgi:3-methylcrotonyl-CoA carboxylase alpha subunit